MAAGCGAAGTVAAVAESGTGETDTPVVAALGVGGGRVDVPFGLTLLCEPESGRLLGSGRVEADL